MTKSEKKINPRRHVNVEAVKDRLFDKHFAEHSFLKELIAAHFPGHLTTGLENSGIAARIAKLHIDHDIDDMADDVRTGIGYLAAMYEGSEKKFLYPEIGNVVATLATLLRLLDWLYAYGPREVKM